MTPNWHPLRAVIRRTGLSADAIRAWENRYHAVAPERSAGGQRLYSDQDLERLILLRRVTALGRNISQVARLRAEELRLLIAELDAPLENSLRPAADSPAAESLRGDGLRLIEELSGAELELLFRRGVLDFGLGLLIDQVAVPLEREVEDRRRKGELTLAHQQMTAAALGAALQWTREGATTGAGRIVLANPAGEPREAGLHIIAALAAAASWEVIQLGGNLPVEDIVQAVHRIEPRILGLSPVPSGSAEPLTRLRSSLPNEVAMLVWESEFGSIGNSLDQAGILVLSTSSSIRDFLASYE